MALVDFSSVTNIIGCPGGGVGGGGVGVRGGGGGVLSRTTGFSGVFTLGGGVGAFSGVFALSDQN